MCSPLRDLDRGCIVGFIMHLWLMGGARVGSTFGFF
jgi:hypothetical protein